MAIRTRKPTSAGRRFQSVSDFAEITKDRPEKTLLAPRSGTYRMAFGADSPVTLELDGQPIEIQQESAETWGQLRQGTPVELAAGEHQVRVTMAISPAGRTLIRWIWALPTADGQLDADAAWSVVPPTRLRPETPWWPAEPSSSEAAS